MDSIQHSAASGNWGKRTETDQSQCIPRPLPASTSRALGDGQASRPNFGSL